MIAIATEEDIETIAKESIRYTDLFTPDGRVVEVNPDGLGTNNYFAPEMIADSRSPFANILGIEEVTHDFLGFEGDTGDTDYSSSSFGNRHPLLVKTVSVMGILVTLGIPVILSSHAKADEFNIGKEMNFGDQNNYTSILSFNNYSPLKKFEFGFGMKSVNVFDDGSMKSRTGTYGMKIVIPVSEKTSFEPTVLLENSEDFGTNVENNRFKLRADLGHDPFKIGALYGKTEKNNLGGVYITVGNSGNLLGLGCSTFDSKTDPRKWKLNYLGIIDWKYVPLVRELLVSAGTSGIEPIKDKNGKDSNKYFSALRVPNQEDGNLSLEGFTIFNEEEVIKYLLRFVYGRDGKIRMGPAGFYDYNNGTSPGSADLYGFGSLTKERDVIPGRDFPLLPPGRGEFTLEVSGKECPIIEATCNLDMKGYWGGCTYDTGAYKDKFGLEGGVDIYGFKLRGSSNLHDNHMIRLDKSFKF